MDSFEVRTGTSTVLYSDPTTPNDYVQSVFFRFLRCRCFTLYCTVQIQYNTVLYFTTYILLFNWLAECVTVGIPCSIEFVVIFVLLLLLLLLSLSMLFMLCTIIFLFNGGGGGGRGIHIEFDIDI